MSDNISKDSNINWNQETIFWDLNVVLKGSTNSLDICDVWMSTKSKQQVFENRAFLLEFLT